MTPRPSLSRKQRAEIFRDAGGICHLCTRKIAEGEEWEVEHVLARGLTLDGGDTRENMLPAHVDCHAPKTARDRKLIARNDKALIANTPGLRKRSAWRGKRANVRQLDEERDNG